MSYEIRYEGDAAEKEAKALADCKNWLGEAQYRKVCEILQQAVKEGASEELLLFGLSMQGIQGYPAAVLVQNAGGKKTKISGELSTPAGV
jgi:hypothetical protein